MNPLQFLKSQCWKLTLPVGKPDEILMPALADYSSEWFRLSANGDGATFIAPTDGATTSGSKNPRSELREMWPDGKTKAAWSSTVGTHSMLFDFTVDALPLGSKPVVVVGQIHDANDDVTVFRVEGATSGDRRLATLYVTDGNTSKAHRIGVIKLGERVRVGFYVSGGIIRYFHGENLLPYQQSKKVVGCYFKVGSYCQSGGNITRLPDGRADFAQVTIHSVRVCHDGVCQGEEEVPAPPAGNDARVEVLEQQVATLTAQVATLKATNEALRKVFA